MDSVTQQNAALVEQAAAAAESMQQQAQRLSDAVSFFKMGAPPAARQPHGLAIRNKLTRATLARG